MKNILRSFLFIGICLFTVVGAQSAFAAEVTVDCSVSSPVTVTYGSTFSSGDDLILNGGSGTCIINTLETSSSGNSVTMNVGNLTVDSGVTLTYDATTTDSNKHYELDFNASGDVVISGTIDVDEMGYQTTYGFGNDNTTPYNSTYSSGGSHGGHGAHPGYTLGESYDDIKNPAYPGGGGGTDAGGGGNGGGVVRITAGADIQVDGTITANGGSNSKNYSGGGAGGTIYLNGATIILGSSSVISADGGATTISSTASGAGGGGMIAFDYTTLTDNGGDVHAYGGAGAATANWHGFPGTVFHDNNGTEELYVEVDANLMPLVMNSEIDTSFDSVNLSNSGILFVESDADAFSTTKIHIPAGTVFESDADYSISSIDSSNLYLDGGIAKFDGDLTFTSDLDTTSGLANASTLITNGNVYINGGDVVIGNNLTWEANTMSHTFLNEDLYSGEGDITFYSTVPFIFNDANEIEMYIDGNEITCTTIHSVFELRGCTYETSRTHSMYAVVDPVLKTAILKNDNTPTELVDSVTVKSGGVLTTSGTTPNKEYDLIIDIEEVDGSLTVESGGSVNVDGKGYLGAYGGSAPYYQSGIYINGDISCSGDGECDKMGASYNADTLGFVNGSYSGSGGSHGGRGGDGSSTNIADSYDSISNPKFVGGGGGGNSQSYGYNGGGVIRITADTITLSDSLTADGDTSAYTTEGGGAGGSVYLNATTITLADTKAISADGGDAHTTSSGGGGGGRVALLYTTLTNNNTGDDDVNITAEGGNGDSSTEDGAAGTVFLHDQAETYGDLYVKNCATCAEPHFHTSLLTDVPTDDQQGDNDAYIFENTIVDSYGVLNIPSDLDAVGDGGTDNDREFFCTNCAEDGNGNDNDTIGASDGEIVYNVPLFSGGLTADYVCVEAVTALAPITCAGQTLVEGVDFATDDDVTLTGSGTCYITIDENEASGDAYVTMGSLTIGADATLSHAATDTTADHHNELDIHVTGAVDISGDIDVAGRGYNGDSSTGYTEGNVTTNGSAWYTGGSHGGRGGIGSSGYVAASSYDLIDAPTKPGGGGGGTSSSNGGGVVMITSGSTIAVNGNIYADGADSSVNGAGAGGTIFLDGATSLTIADGSVLSADGGAGNPGSASGGGGGGRISLITAGTFTNNNTGDDDVNITTYGGNADGAIEDGSAGTVYISDSGADDLYINANSLTAMYYGTEIDTDNDLVFDNVYLKNNGRLFLQSDADDFLTTLLHIPANTVFESDADIPSADGYSIDEASMFLDGGTAKFDGLLEISALDTDGDDAETGTLITNGTTYIDSGDVDLGSGLIWEANSDEIEKSDGIDLVSITVTDGGTLTTSEATDDTFYDLEIVLTGALTVDAGGFLNVDDKGYMGGSHVHYYYDGGVRVVIDTGGYAETDNFANGAYYNAGGSHGGRGGRGGSYEPPASYDSISLPIKPGGGGGKNEGSGNGGGVIKLTAATFVLNNDITANGGDGDADDGGGAGGTIYLNASTSITLKDGNSIAANGGDSGAGAGGGGRIALIYPTSGLVNNNTGDDDEKITAYGGNADGAIEDGSAGTVYFSENGADGDLYINANSLTTMYYGTEIDSKNDETFDNVYLKNYARLFLKSDADDFLTTLLHIPTNTFFESDVDIPSADGYSIDEASIFLDGGTAQFDGLLEISAFDTDGDDAETGTLITNGTTYIANGDVDIGSGLIWEANSDEIEKSDGIDLVSITVTDGGTLTTSEATASVFYDLEITLGTLTVDAGGFLNVDDKGYMGGSHVHYYYDGGVYKSSSVGSSADTDNFAAGASYNTGGSHGGRGGKGNANYDPPASYDSISLPTKPGGGGGRNVGSGNGGGVIKLTAAMFVLNNDITANGGDGDTDDGGGAGGTIYLNASTSITLKDGNSIAANGGDSGGGGGGGGRVALIYPTSGLVNNNTGDDDEKITAYGGNADGDNEDGSAGTVYFSENGADGDLYINANSLTTMYYGTEIDSKNDETFDSVYLKNYARLFLKSDADDFLTTLLHISTNTFFESDADIPSADGYSIDEASIFLDGGTAKFDGLLEISAFDTDGDDAETGTLITNGTTYIASGDVDLGSGLIWEANSDEIEKSNGIDLVSITVTDGGTLTTSEATDDTFYDLEIALGTLTVDVGGILNVNDKGYMGGNHIHYYYDGGVYKSSSVGSYGDTEDFASGASYYAAGSHGGRGGKGGDYASPASYDSISSPTKPGGGGGKYEDSGNGGGVIRITASTAIYLYESIAADGGDGGTSDGGGAGGSIYLEVGSSASILLDTDKVISANGGIDGGTNSAGGGGGRIAILYPNGGFTNNGIVSAYGGSNGTTGGDDGSAGTVFLHDTSVSYGDLYVVNCGANCDSPDYHTNMLATVPDADKNASHNDGYVFENLIVDGYGILNIPSGLDANGTGAEDTGRKFLCNNCDNDGNGSSNLNGDASDGEVVYNVEAFGTLPDYVCVGLNALADIIVNSIEQKTDGSGYVDINIEIDDGDVGDTLTLKIEYDTAGNCGDEVGIDGVTLDSTITADLGTPTIDNGEAFQVQGVSVVDVGSNTLDFDWLSATDLSTGDEDYCLIFTANDGGSDGTPVIFDNLTIDNVAPTGLGTFEVSSHDASSMTLRWDIVTETNFDHYEVWYDDVQANVINRSGASEWDENDIANMGTRTTMSTPIDLGPNVGNYYKIWAVDEFGNESTVADISAYNSADVPGAPTVAANATTGLNSIIDQNSNPSATEYAIQVGTDYVQANGSLDTSAVWQTYATWGGATGEDITGLSSNTQYAVSVKARNGDDDETSFSSTNSKYTFADSVTGVVLSNTSTDSVYSMSLAFTAGTQDVDQHGLKIDYSSVTDGSCNESYGTNNYSSTTVVPGSPRTISATGNTCYQVQIGSYNGDGEINTDYALSNELTTPPAQPIGLATSGADDESITWNFTDVTGATSYNVYRSSDDAYIGNSATSDYTQTTVTDGGAVVSANAQYTVYARAVNANGTGIKSSTASAYTDANAPKNASHDGASQTETVMKWTWESGGAQKEYYAEMASPVANTGWFTSLFWNVSSGLSTNSPYSFEVMARNDEDTETAGVSANAYTTQGTPSGVTFSLVGTDTITVTADGTFANLTSGSSGIRFQNTTSSADNTFQTADWTNSSLDPNTQYSYTVSAKNGDGDETSTVAGAKYTLANVPGVPTVDGNTTSTLDVTVAVNSNPAATQFVIQETGSGEYVQTDGTLGGGEVWQIVGTGAGEWGNTTTTSGRVLVSGLAIDTSYEFQVKTRNGESVETAYGTAASSTTSIEDGLAPTLSEATQTTMDLLIDQGANPASTTYKLTETSTTKYVQIDGSLGDTEVWQTAVEWGTESGTEGQITLTGLTASTEYTFTSTPKSSGGGEGAESTAATLSTAAVPVVEDTGGGGSPAVFLVPTSSYGGGSGGGSEDAGSDGDSTEGDVEEDVEVERVQQTVDEVEDEVQEFLEEFEVSDFVEVVGDGIDFAAGLNIIAESTRLASDDGMSLSIFAGTRISADGSESFGGSISAPVGEDIPVFADGLNVIYSLRIDTSSDESVYFSQPALVSMSAENVAGYDAENLYVYYYDADQGDYNYNGRLALDLDAGVAAFMTSHLTSFVIVNIDDEEGEGEGVEVLGDYSVFADVDGHWAENYVTQLYEMGAVSGKMTSKFAPNDEITRAEFAKIVLFALDYEIKEYDEASFTDLDKDHWAFDIVETAADHGILNGYEEGTVEPDEPVTRAEALAMIFSAMNQSVYGGGIPDTDFGDVNREKWYVYHIDFAVHKGIAEGYEDGTFQPKENVLRGEAAKLIIEAQLKLVE